MTDLVPIEGQLLPKTGRPSKKHPDLIDEICARLATGEPLAVICREEYMPHPSTVRDWMAADADLSRRIAHAREDGEDQIAAKTQEIVLAPPVMTMTEHGEKVDTGDVALRKVQADHLLKLLSKWNPKRWGEKLEVEHSGKIELSDRLRAARERAGIDRS